MTIQARSFSELISFTRASSATYFDSGGVLRTATSNVPRFDYNPITLAIRGLLVEEQRTNSIRNNTMVGAVAGTPGTAPTNWDITSSGTGITQQIVGTGTEDGITYIDVRFSGTGSGSASPQIRPETTTGIVAASGQTWTSSYYLRIVGGSTSGCSGTFQQIWQERDAAGVTLNTATVVIADPTTAALKTQRSILTRTLTDAGTARLTNRIQWTFTDGAAVDITLRIGMPQLEQGAFATSVISTTAAAATRAADTASISSLSPWYKSSEGTILAEVQMLAAPITPGPGIPFALTAAGSSHMALRMRGSQKAGASVVDASVTVVDTASAGNYTTNISKLSFGYLLNNFASSLNGESPAVDTTGTVPTLTDCNVGSMAGSAYLNGWLRRIVYYPNRLTNAELQAITT